MKKVLFAATLITALSGCQMTNKSEADWKQDNKIEMMNAKIELNSAIWIDQMPTIGEDSDESKVNFALGLSSKQVIAPELNIERVELRQGDDSWEVTEEEYEVRVQDNHNWEVAGQTFHTLDASKKVDIAIKASGEWIIETNVSVDTVY
ncbi:membrane lipoprotein lipid attachment site-containing protein [Aliivibrio fischeri]|uniref:membrane lipoprotein lipid attachment site-containing protein n=1 Tax=Aliivibrio fischeri TaxID=668 RepID=UPI0007C4316C|nr:membrane lipoprotein lipid attachment site-containing protein [Aliivibrio fischeri]MBP3142743.1 membrane lipoprotein lipid attachment site-containing protein [Aliivibrio fischeri]MBP3156635.1 membrane lipoprotein lipid attachment site-containing protein [Aliivibrio fischeri]MCE7573368.1 membrane lipoprotein lipid attachment site-containing protein [Aliivibrio fischeri]MUK41024.1 hypothetical protein [Aliivibrio fischeri]